MEAPGSMPTLSNGEKAMQAARESRWFKWAGQHKGIVLLGALVIVFLAYHHSPPGGNFERDSNGLEVPLFI